jgi:hypothetical protein
LVGLRVNILFATTLGNPTKASPDAVVRCVRNTELKSKRPVIDGPFGYWFYNLLPLLELIRRQRVTRQQLVEVGAIAFGQARSLTHIAAGNLQNL